MPPRPLPSCCPRGPGTQRTWPWGRLTQGPGERDTDQAPGGGEMTAGVGIHTACPTPTTSSGCSGPGPGSWLYDGRRLAGKRGQQPGPSSPAPGAETRWDREMVLEEAGPSHPALHAAAGANCLESGHPWKAAQDPLSGAHCPDLQAPGPQLTQAPGSSTLPAGGRCRWEAAPSSVRLVPGPFLRQQTLPGAGQLSSATGRSSAMPTCPPQGPCSLRADPTRPHLPPRVTCIACSHLGGPGAAQGAGDLGWGQWVAEG